MEAFPNLKVFLRPAGIWNRDGRAKDEATSALEESKSAFRGHCRKAWARIEEWALDRGEVAHRASGDCAAVSNLASERQLRATR